MERRRDIFLAVIVINVPLAGVQRVVVLAETNISPGLSFLTSSSKDFQDNFLLIS